MPIVRRKLDANTVYPTTIRYNPDTDTVQSLVNDEWVDNPAADPRTQTTLPPRITADPNCDAAQSVVDALKSKIDDILEAIDNSQPVFTIAGIILSLFTLGAFAIFVTIALTIGNAMLDAGTTALEAALTPTVYDILKCIIFCEMDGNGHLTEGSLPLIEANVTDQIGGLGAVIINSMLALAGEGGINNLASQGTATGDCSDCTSCACETILLHLNSSGTYSTSFDSDVLKTYTITYSQTGIVGVDGGGDYIGDAFYYEHPPGDPVWTVYGGANGMNVPVGSVPAFQNSHVYIFAGVAGTGAPFDFHFTDPSYVENSGQLKIKVCEE